MISQTKQRIIMSGMVLTALFLFVLAAIYQDDNKLDQPNIIGGDAIRDTEQAVGYESTGGQATGGQGAGSGSAQAAVSPIEGFLPRSGEASACREAIGVDLAQGFGATLTINGRDIAPEDMNVNLDDEGAISNVITASRSLGHYTFDPDDNCPNGRFVRPVGNVLNVCVFRLEDTSRACAVRAEHIFDAA